MKTLLTTITAALLLIGCSSNEEKTTQSEAVQAPEKIVEKAAPKAEAAVPATQATAPKAETAEEPQTAAPVVETAKEAAAKAVEEVKTAVATAAPAPAAAIDGAMMFKQKCASCHGQMAEKSALGKSNVIAGWDVAKIVDALKGYKA